MDRSLTTLIALSAKNFLSTSSKLEPYIPSSHQNTSYALKWLGSLGKMTQVSLRTEVQVQPAPQEPAAAVQSTAAQPSPTEAFTRNGLAPQKSQSGQPVQTQTAPTTAKTPASEAALPQKAASSAPASSNASRNQALLDALLASRQMTAKAFSKKPGTAPIFRNRNQPK